jgi:hypothetical protein
VTYPHFEHIIEGKDKDKLLIVKPSIKANFGLVIYFILSVIAVVYTMYYLKVSGIQKQFFLFHYLSPRWLALIPVGILIEIVRRHLNNLYIFSHTKVQRLQGRISFQYSIPSVNYADIRGITIEQSFYGRIFGFGDILLGTAAQDDTELTLEGVDDPYELGKIIESFRVQNLKKTDKD